MLNQFILKGIIALLALILSSAASNANTRSITIAADYWCPYNCTPGSEYPGYIVEIIDQVFQQQGYQVIYKNLPWKRAVQLVRQGKLDGLIGTYPSETPDLIFPSIEQGISKMRFYVKKDDPWRYQQLPSLQQRKVGFNSGYAYNAELDEFFNNHNNQANLQGINSHNATELNLRMLMAGRLNTILANQNVMDFYVDKLNLQQQLNAASDMQSLPLNEKIYVAFSPSQENSIMFAKWLSKGMDALHKSGQLDKILAKYHLKNWLQAAANSPASAPGLPLTTPPQTAHLLSHH